ncbi:MAG: Gfo/Idh/MocA family oxidoreductase [Parcubacteria group bacterium]
MNIGIIGVGEWGKRILRVANELSKVTRCANKHDVSWIEENYPEIKATLDYHDILNDRSIDAVVIAVPHNELFKVSKDAIISGKHVFIEKPMAQTSNQAKELISLKHKDQIIFIGYVFMYSPIYKKIKSIISTDPIINIDAKWSKFGTFDNDIIFNLASHDIAITLDLFSKMPGRALIKEKTKDTVIIKLGFGRDKTAKINIDRMSPLKRKEVNLITESGRKIYWINNKLLERYNNENGFRSLLDTNESNLIMEYKEFISCINEKREPVTNDILACKVLNIIEQINE